MIVAMAEPLIYPRRPKFFAHRFTRLLGKTCIGAEIGPDACWLLTYIAHTEDAAGYARPVTFFNEDLATRLGMSVSAMRRARDRAVKGGWLTYIEGKKRKAPAYFVTVPDWAIGRDDSPGDEQNGELEVTDSPVIPRQIDASSGREPAGNRQASGREPAGNRQASGQPSSLSLSLSLSQDPPKPPAESVGPPAASYDPLRAEQDARKLFERRWNESGLRKFSRLTHGLHSRLAALLLDPWWAEHYPAALAKAGQSPFLAGGVGRTNGPLDPADFLRSDDVVRQILDGRFDQYATGPPRSVDRKQAELDAVFAEAAAKRKAG